MAYVFFVGRTAEENWIDKQRIIQPFGQPSLQRNLINVQNESERLSFGYAELFSLGRMPTVP